MSTYRIEKVTSPPILKVIFQENFNGEDQIRAFLQDLAQTYNALEEPVVQITDIRALDLNFDSVMWFLRESTRGDLSIIGHRMSNGFVVVTENRFHMSIINGLARASFGALNIRVLDNMDEALIWASQQ